MVCPFEIEGFFLILLFTERSVANKSAKNPWKSVKVSDPLQRAINVLSRHHHVAVEQAGKLVNMLSQMDVLRWFHNDPQRMGPAGRKTLQGLKLHRKRVVCVRSTDLAVDAFFSLYNSGVTGAAVVNNEGKLVGCLSASDLKLLGDDFDFTNLLRPVSEFLDETDPVVVHHFDTLSDAVAKIVTSHVHRVFVCAPGGFPVGVVSTTDVLAVFKEEKKKEKEGKSEEKKKKKKK